MLEKLIAAWVFAGVAAVATAAYPTPVKQYPDDVVVSWDVGGGVLVASFGNGQVVVWEIASGKKIGHHEPSVQNHDCRIQVASAGNADPLFVLMDAGNQTKNVRLFDGRTCKVMKEGSVPLAHSLIYGIAADHESIVCRQVASADLYFITLANGEITREFKGSGGHSGALTVTSDLADVVSVSGGEWRQTDWKGGLKNSVPLKFKGGTLKQVFDSNSSSEVICLQNDQDQYLTVNKHDGAVLWTADGDRDGELIAISSDGKRQLFRNDLGGVIKNLPKNDVVQLASWKDAEYRFTDGGKQLLRLAMLKATNAKAAPGVVVVDRSSRQLEVIDAMSGLLVKQIELVVK